MSKKMIEIPAEANVFEFTPQIEVCGGCKGTGRQDGRRCDVCQGSGRIVKTKRVIINIEPYKQ